jgi:hypothetical protein
VASSCCTGTAGTGAGALLFVGKNLRAARREQQRLVVE